MTEPAASSQKKNRRQRKRDQKPAHPAHPRFWHVWLFMLPLTILAAWTPWPVARFIGYRIGDLSWMLLRSRRRITLRNLELCFPQWSEEKRHITGRDSFRSTGIAVFESSRAWWQPIQRIAADFELHGVEHLEHARAQGRGVMLFGLHLTALEITGAAASHHFPINTIFRPQNNAGMEALVSWRRKRIYTRQIDRRDIRTIYRALKDNEITWYTGDQDFGRQHAVFVPFFGVPAATIVAGMRFARANHSVALGVSFRRDDHTGHYILEFSEPLAFTDDDEADALVMNRHIETAILKAPGQYMWYHKRFKTLQNPSSGSSYP